MATVRIDSTNEQVGQNEKKVISSSGEATVTNESVVEPVPGPNWENLAELEKFMQEEVLVLVHPPMDDGEGRFVRPGVNGVFQTILCDHPQRIKRKYLEVLARSRRELVTAEGYKDGRMDAKNVVNIHKSARYAFQVLEDPNPRGPAWLRQVLAEN